MTPDEMGIILTVPYGTLPPGNYAATVAKARTVHPYGEARTLAVTLAVDRSQWWRTAGHPPPNTVPLTSNHDSRRAVRCLSSTIKSKEQ